MKQKGWLARLGAGLKRSSTKLTGGIGSIFKGKRVDAATLGELEDLLILSDMGPATAAKLTGAIGKRRFQGDDAAEGVAEALAEEIAAILRPLAVPLEIDRDQEAHSWCWWWASTAAARPPPSASSPMS